MSHRFNITPERKLETKPGAGGDDVVAVRRIELVTGRGRRREWSPGEKARILVDSAVPGANVSEVARRNGLSPQQLFAWRREAREMFAASGEPAPSAGKDSGARYMKATRTKNSICRLVVS